MALTHMFRVDTPSSELDERTSETCDEVCSKNLVYL